MTKGGFRPYFIIYPDLSLTGTVIYGPITQQCTPTGYAAFICKHMLVSKMADQQAASWVLVIRGCDSLICLVRTSVTFVYDIWYMISDLIRDPVRFHPEEVIQLEATRPRWGWWSCQDCSPRGSNPQEIHSPRGAFTRWRVLEGPYTKLPWRRSRVLQV